jgi:soluble lytic murein transglycosylase-like protein
MPSRLSAFVVPSERFTLRFDPTAPPLPPGERQRRPARRAAVGLVTSLAVVLLATVASAARATPRPPSAGLASAGAPAAGAQPAAGAGLAQPFSGDDLYRSAAATCPGLPASVLAAIHHVETRSSARGEISTAGARGPMQFLPSTWARYGVDADGDGQADIEDLVDAVYAAADYLCANGGGDPTRLRGALWNYNHSWDYVEQVLAAATT